MNCGTSGTGGTGERVEKAGRAGSASRTGDCGTGREFLNSELGTSCKLAPAGDAIIDADGGTFGKGKSVPDGLKGEPVINVRTKEIKV